MTFAEFLCLVEEYELPVENPERFRFMIKDMSADEFRAHLDGKAERATWIYGDEPDVLLDGSGNRWRRAHNPNRNE
jgi:hypothetical protein